MAKKAKRGSAFQYTVLGYTQTRVQQKAALKLSFFRECEEIVFALILAHLSLFLLIFVILWFEKEMLIMDLLIKLSMLVVFFSVTIGIGLYWRGATVLSVWVSFIFSTVVMLAGLVLVPVISLFTPKPDKAHLDHIFSCYEKKVTVTVRDSIGDSSDN